MTDYLKDDAAQLAIDAADVRTAIATGDPAAERKVGMDVDVTTNVLVLLGKVGETVSLHTAIAGDKQHKIWGCIGCRLLGAFVQKGHCAAQFTSAPSPDSVYLRAGICFVGGFVGVGGLLASGALFALAALLGVL